MTKKRVYEVARAEGLPSALVLQRLQRAGLSVKTASSTESSPWVGVIRVVAGCESGRESEGAWLAVVEKG